MNFFLRAADEVELDFDNLVAIGGVGCAARIPAYLNAEGLHGIHGRTLPWATGIKLHRPDLNVVIFSGDGDAAAIGGNHLIQAARRNLDVTMIVVNNLNFGMTGGQMAPTTLTGLRTTTTPFGTVEKPFDLCNLVTAAGATLVSRWTTHHARQAIRAIKEALEHTGFAFVEIVSQCPTNFGRRALGTDDPVEGVRWIAERSRPETLGFGVETGERQGFGIGNLVKRSEPVFQGSSVQVAREA
jgi:2-oxoglutarate ferredoxin oxidoreductase subunit beta